MAMYPKLTRDTHPEMHNGDRMTQSEFHRAYELMPASYRAELIGGVVFEPSPLGYPHGTTHVRLGHLVQSYVMETPGVEAADNATVILGDEDEVQPDLILRVISGGHSRSAKYVEGAPELVAEIAHSSRAIDLHLKKQRYAQAGVREYIVVTLDPEKLYWFDMQNNVELSADAEGITRSAAFPGLWIHGQGLLDSDHKLTAQALTAGLQSSEHQKFVVQLADREKRRGQRSNRE